MSKATESLDISNRKLREEHPIRSRIFFMGLVRVVFVECRIRDNTILFFNLDSPPLGGEGRSAPLKGVIPNYTNKNTTQSIAPKYSGKVKSKPFATSKISLSGTDISLDYSFRGILFGV